MPQERRAQRSASSQAPLKCPQRGIGGNDAQGSTGTQDRPGGILREPHPAPAPENIPGGLFLKGSGAPPALPSQGLASCLPAGPRRSPSGVPWGEG